MIAVLAVCAGAWWWTSRTPRQPAASESGSAAENAAQAAPPATGPTNSVAADEDVLASVAMPSANLPLIDRLASLQSRADAGDSLAACRLGMELLRCAALRAYQPGHDDFMARQEAELEAKGDLATADRIATGRLQHAQLRDACAGVPPLLVDRAHHYVRQAALAGEREAMIRYARGETLMAGTPSMAFISTPEFDSWRREARPVLMRALESGHPEAVLILAKAHGGNDSHLAMLLPRDAVEARASLLLARRLFDDDPALARGLFGDDPPRPLEDATQTLDRDQDLAAEQMAQDWQARSFKGRRFVLADNTAALLPLHRRIDWDDGSYGWPGQPGAESCAPPAAGMP